MLQTNIVFVYSCPYCSTLVFFDTLKELEWHIYKSHLQQAIHLIAKECRETAKRKNMKWCLT